MKAAHACARAGIALILALAPALTCAADPPSRHPLLEFARDEKRHPKLADLPRPGTDDLRYAERERERAHVPPDTECAHSLGAQRFGQLHFSVASERLAIGDLPGAIVAYRSALSCSPLSIRAHQLLASALFAARDFAGARAVIDTALILDPRYVDLHRVAGNLDFVAGRWADATARFRYVAASDLGRSDAEYGQIMLWLAQRRAGVASPQFVQRTLGDEWPRPLLLYLSGRYDEADLIEPITAGDEDYESNTASRDRLCQALFYVGETYLARGDADVAREYFAAAVNTKARDRTEYDLAMAEIARLR